MRKFRKWLRAFVKTKKFNVILISSIIFLLILIASGFVVDYQINGETQMPFEVSKINVVSSVGGEDITAPTEEEKTDNKWNITVSQNNDIYFYIEKNEKYKGRKEEAIQSVVFDNFEITKESEKGTIKIYKPEEELEKVLFKNVVENEVQNLEFVGSKDSKVKSMQMSNQGDLIYFRITNKDLARYTSNDEELQHNDLLKKCEVSEEQTKLHAKFDMQIKLESRKVFKATIEADFPVKGIEENGTSSGEIIDVNKLIFKRN